MLYILYINIYFNNKSKSILIFKHQLKLNSGVVQIINCKWQQVRKEQLAPLSPKTKSKIWADREIIKGNS